MGPERKLWHELKRNTPKIKWTRLENTSLLGTPDLLGYNSSGKFFTLELKTTSANKIKFSPHQIAFHIRHPKNTFILVKSLGQSDLKLFQGTQIIFFAQSAKTAPDWRRNVFQHRFFSSLRPSCPYALRSIPEPFLMPLHWPAGSIRGR